MLKKWKTLKLRKKILLITGILFVLSIPTCLITSFAMAFSFTLFVISFFYNIHKMIKMLEEFDVDEQKHLEEEEGPEMITIKLVFALGVGSPIILVLLGALWGNCF